MRGGAALAAAALATCARRTLAAPSVTSLGGSGPWCAGFAEEPFSVLQVSTRLSPRRRTNASSAAEAAQAARTAVAATRGGAAAGAATAPAAAVAAGHAAAGAHGSAAYQAVHLQSLEVGAIGVVIVVGVVLVIGLLIAGALSKSKGGKLQAQGPPRPTPRPSLTSSSVPSTGRLSQGSTGPLLGAQPPVAAGGAPPPWQEVAPRSATVLLPGLSPAPSQAGSLPSRENLLQPAGSLSALRVALGDTVHDDDDHSLAAAALVASRGPLRAPSAAPILCRDYVLEEEARLLVPAGPAVAAAVRAAAAGQRSELEVVAASPSGRARGSCLFRLTVEQGKEGRAVMGVWPAIADRLQYDPAHLLGSCGPLNGAAPGQAVELTAGAPRATPFGQLERTGGTWALTRGPFAALELNATAEGGLAVCAGGRQVAHARPGPEALVEVNAGVGCDPVLIVMCVFAVMARSVT